MSESPYLAATLGTPAVVVALLLTTLSCSPPPQDPPDARPPDETPAVSSSLARSENPDADPAARELTAGEPVRAEITGGERHVYTVTAAAGTAAAVEVTQRGADVVVALWSPDGDHVTTVDSFTGDSGSEHLYWVSDAGGDHRVEVELLDAPGVAPGAYTVLLTAPPRPATERDRALVAAARIYARGVEHLAAGRSAESAAAFAAAAAGYHRLGETLLLAGALFSEAQVLWNPRRDAAAAVEPYRRAAALYRRLGMSREEALTRANLGEMLRQVDRYQEAIAAYEAAWTLYRGLPELADGDRMRLAIVLNNLGRLYSILADSESALERYERSLELIAAAQREDGPRVLSNLADEYRLNGHRSRALRLYDQAIALSRQRGDREELAWSLSKRCLTLHEMARTEEAATCIREAVALHREAGTRRGEAVSRVTLAQIAERQDDLETARENQKAALRVFRKLDDEMSTAIVLSNLAWNDLRAGDAAAALRRFHSALPTIERLGRPREQADVLAGLARAYAELDRLREALDTNRRAIELLERLRRGPAAPSLRAMALARRHSIYAFQVELLMRRHERDPDGGWDAAALTACEMARARTLLETLAMFQTAGPSTADRPAAEEKRLMARLRNLELRRITLLWDGDEEASNSLANLERQIEETELAWQRLWGGRAASRAADRQLTEPLDAARIQRRAVDAGSLMLAYHLGRERSFLWVVGKDRLESHVLPPRRRVEAAARRAHELAADSRLRTRRIHAELELAELSRLLLEPVAERIAGSSRLLFVAEGALLYVPFAALPLPGDGRPVVAEHEVVVLPSASTLAALRHRLARRPPAPGAVAVIADPVFQPDDPRLGGAKPGLAESWQEHLQRSGESLERLPHSRREAEAILKLAPAGERFVATDFAANLDAVLSGDLAGYRVVHLATHARVYADPPKASLVLSRLDAHGNPRHGELRSDQIYRLSLPAELVTLSACGTALGQEIRGEGLVGLTHGFLTAGAARVLVSLWSVGDESTAVLMERFYHGLFRQGLSPAAALRAAQHSMWSEPRWQAPYHWAGFVLQGEPR